ncbi:nitrogen regulation protein NR(II) [Melaminivora sp.]
MPGYCQALDWLSTPIAWLDVQGHVRFANMALHNLLGQSRHMRIGAEFGALLADGQPLEHALQAARTQQLAELRFVAELLIPLQAAIALQVSVRPAEGQAGGVLVELWPMHPSARHEREERLREQGEAQRQLVRNLAHEIKNPLGGIRGAAQLLELELPASELAEYTRVIVREADRLRALVDRLLAPHQHSQQLAAVNIHEVCEHVGTLLLAEHPAGLTMLRDYDASIPELPAADREQLVQALLNITRNAAQALAARIAAGDALITLRSRVARQVVLGQRSQRMVLRLEVLDNGPGIPEALRERIFLPLVSGREGGTGLGLTLAQAVAQRHGGVLECEDSRPGNTRFCLQLPLA